MKHFYSMDFSGWKELDVDGWTVVAHNFSFERRVVFSLGESVVDSGVAVIVVDIRRWGRREALRVLTPYGWTSELALSSLLLQFPNISFVSCVDHKTGPARRLMPTSLLLFHRTKTLKIYNSTPPSHDNNNLCVSYLKTFIYFMQLRSEHNRLILLSDHHLETFLSPSYLSSTTQLTTNLIRQNISLPFPSKKKPYEILRKSKYNSHVLHVW